MRTNAKRTLHLANLSSSSIVRGVAIALALAAAPFLPWLSLNRVQSAVINLDPAFGSGGTVTTDFGSNFQEFGNALALQPDGKIVVVGTSGGDFALARYNTNGSLDDGTTNDLTPGDSFGSGGMVTTDIFGFDEAHAVAVQSDDKIVVAGDVNGFGLVRYNADGSLDSNFGSGGMVRLRFSDNGTDRGEALAIQSDGKYVVAGSICPGGQGCDFGLVRYNTNGSLDDGTTSDSTPADSFGSGGKVTTSFPLAGGDDAALAIAIQTDGKLVAAGFATVFLVINGEFRLSRDFALVRYNTDGSLDDGTINDLTPSDSFGSGGKVATDFGTNTLDIPRAIALQPDGKIVVAGGFFSSDGSTSSFALLRYNANGSLDGNFGSGGKVAADGQGLGNAVALEPDGQIVMAGSSTLARFNPNGSLDTNFDSDGKLTTVFEVNAVAIQADGKIVAAGTTVGGITQFDFALARYRFENTPPGTSVVVEPVDTTTGTTPVTLTFSNVTQAGNTSLTTSSSGPAPPTGFRLGNPPTFYEITTTALFSGSVTVCIHYTGVSFPNESRLKLFHREAGVWVNRTTTLDTVNDIICGSVASFSLFAIFEEEDVSEVPADLDIEKSDASDPVLLGSNVTYKIEVENRGPGNATNVTITDTLPGSLTNISAPGCSISGQTVTCIIPNLANQQEVKRTIVAQTTVAGKVKNTATVTATEADPDQSNNTNDSETKVVVGVKSVSLSPSTIRGGNNVTGTVKLVAAAPNATVVTLSSSNTSAARPTVSSITINAGQTSKTFTVKTFAVSSTKTVKIKATAYGLSKDATLTVTR